MIDNTLVSTVFSVVAWFAVLGIAAWGGSKIAQVLRSRQDRDEAHLATVKEAKELMKLDDDEADKRMKDSTVILTNVGESLEGMVDRMKELNERMARTAERANELTKSK